MIFKATFKIVSNNKKVLLHIAKVPKQNDLWIAVIRVAKFVPTILVYGRCVSGYWHRFGFRLPNPSHVRNKQMHIKVKKNY